MQIKEFEAFSLKDCLQQVRNALGPEAVILETRKFRKGGLLGLGARDAVCVVAATGITVKNDTLERPPAADPPRVSPPLSNGSSHGNGNGGKTAVAETPTRHTPPVTASQAAAVAAARNAYARNGSPPAPTPERRSPGIATALIEEPTPAPQKASSLSDTAKTHAAPRPKAQNSPAAALAVPSEDRDRLVTLERAMQEIRESLLSLKQEQQEAHERTVTAVVSAVAPAVQAVSTVTGIATVEETPAERMPELYKKLRSSGISEGLAQELLDSLPDLSAWREEAQQPLAESALRDILSRRVNCSGSIVLTPGTLKAVALIGPTGVGKTTTIAKLAAHFALVEHKKVALLTVDTYRIAAVEQLKTYSQIIDIPVAVAYNPAEVLPAIEQFADFDLLLIDTAGRSQKNIMQVGELKAMLETVRCETHLVLSALIKTEDMLEAARRFSAARVDRILFSKLDETGTYGTLFEVADQTGIPLSYLTTGQKVPEDIETADPVTLTDLILN